MSECKSTSMESEVKMNNVVIHALADDTEPVASLDEDVKQEPLYLTSKEGDKIIVNRDSVIQSKLVSTSLETDEKATEVPVPAVSTIILTKVIEYLDLRHAWMKENCREPKKIDKPLRSKNMSDVVENKAEAVFIDDIGVNRQKLYDLILASNYLDIDSLLQLGCAKVASLIKGEPLEKIKDILSVAETK